MTSQETQLPEAAPDGKSGTPRRAKHERRRQEIIDAAAEVFRRKGYSDASIQDIADEVGLLKGSLYHYIEAKEDLLFEVLTGVYELARQNIDKVAAMDDLGPVEKLRAYIKLHLEFNATHTTKIATYYHEFELVGPERRPIIVEQRKQFERFITDLIVAGKESGEIDARVDPKIGAYLILGAMNWTYTWYRPEGRVSPDELGDLAAQLLVDGILSAKRD
ncbi:MAG TPA: TetR/AcrR family transcriptional regulator [Gaiellaceae bacterium]|jgi:AcrR family transcriptional regulator|nr:TetR/AcrR family transcriptional regulator [Gaiellaceae bacterium]